MIEIEGPPANRDACTSCWGVLIWLYSARTRRWVSFTAGPESGVLRVHLCRPGPDSASWRDVPLAPRDPERAHRGAALARRALADAREQAAGGDRRAA